MEMEFDQDNVRERLCTMDTRLETAFIEPVHEPREKIAAESPNQMGKTNSDRFGQRESKGTNSVEMNKSLPGKRRYKQQIVQQVHVTLQKSTPKAKQLPSFESSGKSILQTWLLDLASRAKCPVQVGKDCLAVSHEEILESQKLIKEELAFLRSVCGSSVGLPMQATEVCLLHQQHISNLWKNIHSVFSQLLVIYEKERSSFLLKNDPYSCEEVQRELKVKTLALEDEIFEREKVDIELKQVKQELKEMKEQLASPEKKTIRRRMHPNASGVHLKLKKIHEDLLKLPAKLELSTPKRQLPTTRSVAFKSKASEGGVKDELRVKQKGGKVVREEIQRVVATLEVMSSRDVDAFMKDLDPTIKSALLNSMMQNVLERKDNSIIADIMNSTKSLDDRLLLVKKFADQFSQEQQLTLLTAILDTTSMSDADKSEAAFKFVGCMSRPFAESFVRELGEKYQVEGRARKYAIGQIKRNSLISTIPGSSPLAKQSIAITTAAEANKGDKHFNNVFSRSTQTQQEGNSTLVTTSSQTDSKRKHRRVSNSSTGSDPGQGDSEKEFSEGEDGEASPKAAKKGKKKKHVRSGEHVQKYVRVESMWQKGPPPWEKYMKPAPKKMRVRLLEVTMLEDTLIGEIYQKKCMSDKDHTRKGRNLSTAEIIMHYFTQKYGLKRMAEEYIYSLVKSIRDQARNRNRIQVFGVIVGVVKPEYYTPMLSDVVMEYLMQTCKAEHLAALFANGAGNTFIRQADAAKAVKSIFRVMEDKQDEVESTPCIDSSSRSWVIPAAMRQQLLKYVETQGKSANSLGTQAKKMMLGTTGQIIDLDGFLKAVIDIFLEKLKFDRQMLMDLFIKFDFNGDGVLSYNEFTRLLNDCQPSPPMSESEILDLWVEVNENDNDDDDDSVTKESFAGICVARALLLPYWKVDQIPKADLSTSMSALD